MTTTNGLEDGQIIKTDELGRVRTSRERREALLEEYERSGMSGAAFAQWAGIKYTTFASWAQKRRRAKKVVTPETLPASEPPSPQASTKPLRCKRHASDPLDIVTARRKAEEKGTSRRKGDRHLFLTDSDVFGSLLPCHGLREED